jgi:hypothetical protein
MMIVHGEFINGSTRQAILGRQQLSLPDIKAQNLLFTSPDF